ncbi:MAG TPA: ferritin-like domain-containing protein, partial [Qipengyuania sp.]|nr:ferritin-like domain-containing protein [Qipengyuania sp.]
MLTGEAEAKVFAARKVARDWRLGRLAFAFPATMPDRPVWPAGLELLPPNGMPRRGKFGSERGRIALWHALAHIEFVAIDLALDMAGRFGAERGPHFVSDFLGVAADEAMHFALLTRKLASLGSRYGALPVHDGLWEAAEDTRHDIAARLAVVPMVLEARGLDVTPAMLERVRAAGDENGGRILERILDDEIRHVAVGVQHFGEVSAECDQSPPEMWRKLVEIHFRGGLKP